MWKINKQEKSKLSERICHTEQHKLRKRDKTKLKIRRNTRLQKIDSNKEKMIKIK